MDPDGWVEDDNEIVEDLHSKAHPEVLENATPSFIREGALFALGVVESYGWMLLAAGLLTIWLKHKYWPKWVARQQSREDMAYLNMDPEAVRRREEAVAASRAGMQERHDALTAHDAEKRREREERKRQEKIEDWERHQQGGGYRSKIKPKEDEPSPSETKPAKKNVYRNNDYNPLLGGPAGGSGSTYRPARRGGAGGGGG